jgi:hypothetical protein
MKAYVLTTGVVFGLLVAVHILRLCADGLQVATNPWFVLTTVAAAALCFWAWRLFRRLPRS